MIRTKLGLLGLCAVVFGVMAFAASGAQAEATANWLILNAKSEVKTGAELSATVAGNLETGVTGILLTEVLKIPTRILCTSATLIGVSLEGTGSLTNGGKVQFSSCTVDTNGTLNEKCKPKAGGAEVGTILTNAGKGLLVLIGGVARTRIEPKEGETFATINMGAECPIGESIPVRGKLVIQDSEVTTHKEKHLITEDTVNTDLWVLNKTEEHKAKIDGSAEVFLTGAHATLSWSGDPA
jgi:hypothetical protein